VEKKELMNLLRVIWRNGDSSLRRIYPSWEELEANIDIIVGEERTKATYANRLCPNCGVIQKIKAPLDALFPYQTCKKCKRPFHVNNNLSVRKLTEDEKDVMPAEGVRVIEDLKKKKMAIVFKLE
jgi:hypothetical protein